MRAWFLLLAVLATFKPIVQVASTEETASTIFIKAITPQKEHIYNTTDNSSDSMKSIRTELTTTTTTKQTALGKAFNIEFDMATFTETNTNANTDTDVSGALEFSYDNSNDNVINNSKSPLKSISTAITTTTTTTTTAASESTHHQHQHQHQHHDHQHQNENHHNENANKNTEQNQHHQNHPSSTLQPSSSTPTTTTPTKTPTTATTTKSNANAKDSNHQSDNSTPASALSPSPSSSASSAPTESSSLNDEIDEDPATYSNKEIINEKVKPDPEVLVEIENSLLSLFNMKRPPKIDRSKIIIPEAMKKLYEEIMNQQVVSVNIPKPGLLTKSANTVRSFTHQDSKIDHRFPHHHRFRLYFDIKSIPQKEKLKAAELQLARDAISHAVLSAKQANRTWYQVLAYDITRVGIRGKREPSFLLLDNKTIRLNSTDTVSLDVQPAVERWLAAPKQNYGLLIEVRTSGALKPAPHHHVRLKRSADELHEDWQRKQPLLFTYTDDGRHKSRSIRDVSTRSKRNEHHHQRRGRRRKTHDDCRRHSLYVDFADVGWSDWIVAPPGYDAFYCLGKCPFGLFDHLNTTNHAVVQTLVNNINPAKVPKPCCVPTQLDGISMLYLNDQNTVVLKNYQDMTVVGCGCR